MLGRLGQIRLRLLDGWLRYRSGLVCIGGGDTTIHGDGRVCKVWHLGWSALGGYPGVGAPSTRCGSGCGVVLGKGTPGFGVAEWFCGGVV